jgi:hypothetical protein
MHAEEDLERTLKAYSSAFGAMVAEGAFK